MTKLGYTLSSEEFDAPSLVAQAERAERAGFAFTSISDHFHPVSLRLAVLTRDIRGYWTTAFTETKGGRNG